jgi:hypothetical protein
MILVSIIGGFRKESVRANLVRHGGNAVQLLQGLFQQFGKEQVVTKVDGDPTSCISLA